MLAHFLFAVGYDTRGYHHKTFPQDFDERWDQALLSTNETLTDTILEGSYKSKLQDSVQLLCWLCMMKKRYETMERLVIIIKNISEIVH